MKDAEGDGEEAMEDDDADGGWMRTRIFPSSDGIVSNEMSKPAAFASSSVPLLLGRAMDSESPMSKSKSMPLWSRDQSPSSLEISELMSNAEELQGPRTD